MTDDPLQAHTPSTLGRVRAVLAASGLPTVPVVTLVERKVLDERAADTRKDLRTLLREARLRPRKRLPFTVDIDHPVLWRGWLLGTHRWIDRRSRTGPQRDVDALTLLLDVAQPERRAGVSDGYLVSVTGTERHLVFFPEGQLAPSAYPGVAEQVERLLARARG